MIQTHSNMVSGWRRKAAALLLAPLTFALMVGTSNSAHAATDSASLWTYPVPEAVVQAVEAAHEKAHQSLMDLPLWNATIFGPFPATAITTEVDDITFVHINLPSVYGYKTATVKIGVLNGTTWVNTTLGSIKLNQYGSGTYKTALAMPTGTRAQILVGGKIITATIRP